MADNQAPAGSQGQNRGGGRRRARGGGAGQPGHVEQQQSTGGSGRGSRGKARGARGGGGGGGGGGGREKQQQKNRGGNVNGSSAGAGAEVQEAEKEKKEGPAEGATDDADDGEVCFICASNVEHTSVSPCNHRTCHICALRLRALYKNKGCAHCRTEAKYVVFTDDPNKNFEEFAQMDFSRKDDNLGIQYEKDEIFEDTVLLLRYNCPDRSCDVACLGWPDLHRHVKSKHGKSMCDLCTRNKKVFTHEHALFTTAELRKHEKYGDDVPGAINQSGFKGHPECGFCRQRFYGDDELYTHCRDKHERCHICDRRSGHRQQQYYVDYNALEEHFQKDHFLCLDQECLEKKFVVFESQMDLKGHQLECHPNGLSKDARRDARMVDLSAFDYRTPYQPQRQRRGAGRGRDPNAEPLPPSSAQPLRRDEIAYQRQMAIQSAQSVSNRSFGGQLTRNDTQPVRAPPRSGTATPAARSPPAQSTPVEELQSLNLVADGPAATPQEQARRMRHTTVIERASNLLRNDQTKLREFRTKVSSFRTSSVSATELIDGFFSLFDTSSTELGKLVKELADIYEDEAKRSSLLQAWNDWRAINEDYPALPGPGGLLPGMSPNTVNDSGAGGSRVLRLKSSTAQSSRAAVGRNGALPSSSSSSPSSNPFPPLASQSSSSSRANNARKNTSSSAWGGTTIATPSSSSQFPSLPSSRPSPRPSPAPSSQRTNTVSSSGGGRGGGGGGDAFPALPAAPKPNVLMPGLTRGTVRWDTPRPSVSAWSSAGASDSTPPQEDEFPEIGNSGAGGKGKGKGKKGKQTLFHFG